VIRAITGPIVGIGVGGGTIGDDEKGHCHMAVNLLGAALYVGLVRCSVRASRIWPPLRICSCSHRIVSSSSSSLGTPEVFSTMKDEVKELTHLQSYPS
jgi:hypothetical protein